MKDDGMKKSLNQGHRERLRSRYLMSAGEGLPDYDLLELLLTYAVQRRDVKPIARGLLEKFHDLSGVLNAGLEELCQVPGIGKNSALLILLLRRLCTRYLEDRAARQDVIKSSEDLRNYARMRLASSSDEVLLLICLDVKNHILDSRIIGRGTIDTVVVNPRLIVEEALRAKAAALILVHNHPSGATDPSSDDVNFTHRMQRLLRPLGIRLLDHLIVSRNNSYSFTDHGLLGVEL